MQTTEKQTAAADYIAAHTDTLRALPSLLLPWYAENKRDLPWRHTQDPYRIYVSEIMLQQTRVQAAIGYYERFFALFPTPVALAQADDETLLKAWEGLGYYTRARNLKKAAALVCEKHGGVFPRDYASLIALPGAGAYTAGAVASVAGGERIAAVDGNVLRIAARLFMYGKPADESYKRALAAALTENYPQTQCGDYTQSFMDLASAVCLPKRPNCPACPLNGLCAAYKNGVQDSFPVRAKKAARKAEDRTVFVLRDGDRIAVRIRPTTGVLAGLYELPNVLGFLTEQEAIAAVEGFGGVISGAFTVRNATHVFTHLVWNMRIYDVTVSLKDAPFTLARPDAVALPTAFRKCL